MTRVTFITHEGGRHPVDARPGLSLMENAVASDIAGIEAVCGGNAYCGTCRVYPEPEWQDRLVGRNELEDSLLESDDLARLSCQIEVTRALDGLVVRLPASQGAA